MIKKKKSLILDEEKIREVKNIGRGVFFPLKGFLKKEDFESVVFRMKLKNGAVWPIPIVLDISEKNYQRIKNEKEIVLNDSNGDPVALFENIDIYSYDKDLFAKNVFGTLDKNHPGVKGMYKMGKYLIGGEIILLNDSKKIFPEYNLSPKETKEIFQKKGWKRIVGFQTRNVPHRGHEFLQKYALNKEEIDGLFIQPVIGEKKLKDFKDEFILASYEVLIDRYYPKDRVILGILPLRMRYAGPREAVFHALIRKNFGCTHFIVGRDHAGVGGYYPPLAAQEIFDTFKKEEIGIEILKYPEVVYCSSCKKHIFRNGCRHPEKDKISFSGTKLREKIRQGKQPLFYIIRPEVYHLLSSSSNALVDSWYKNQEFKQQKGFCLWLTGLSQSGKTTIGNKLYKILKKKGLKVERLDGDIIRQSLSKDLGFTKEDRNENIKRVGSLARLFVQRQIITIASFISPYKKQRQELRKKIPNFIEVFVNCPLKVCEKRDEKGLYKKAKRGEIKNFTGISDPYRRPENPEIELSTDRETIEENVNKVTQYLKENEFI
jgi:sulfate adenylyltransferase